MMHVVQWRTYQKWTPDQLTAAIATAQALQKAIANLEGVWSCKLTIGRGTFAYFSDVENFAVLDKAFTDLAVQAMIGKLILEFGYHEASAEFFYDLEQVFPFIKK